VRFLLVIQWRGEHRSLEELQDSELTRMRAAYRREDGEAYAPLWPPGETTFRVN